MSGALPTVLVLAPMPAFPASAGNRRRLVATCEALQRGGFAVDFAYWAHEDQIYRRFGHHPPTDLAAMEAAFQRVFLIEPRATIPLKTRAKAFGIDDWCPDEVGDFVAWYFSKYPATGAILVNYVFLSRALQRVPPGVLKLIDTHDRFSGRQIQYRPFRAEPNFFYTDDAGEAAGLNRADIVLAIQSAEARFFETLTTSDVHLLPPYFPPRSGFSAPDSIRRIGFIGHGNDPNLFSIRRFAEAWSEGWTPDRPELAIAGEICTALGQLDRPGVKLLGYVDRIEAFYETVDVVVAPMLMGSGLKMKVAEALSFGMPVIGTRLGFEGFDPTEPAHRCEDAEAVKARVLALVADRSGLAALTAACETLFAGYNAAAVKAEQVLIARLGQHPARPEVPTLSVPPTAAELPATETDSVLALSVERSSRSLPATDPELGHLVATERRPANAAGYAPLRRRWFVRAAGSTVAGSIRSVGAMSVAFSPEWVRERGLSPELRAALAVAFAEVRADWEAHGRPIGFAGGCIEVVLDLPSFLATGRHPSAVFLIATEEGRALELRLERITPLQVRPVASIGGATKRDDLALVPASARFSGVSEASMPRGCLLLLTDDLIGRITLAGGNSA